MKTRVCPWCEYEGKPLRANLVRYKRSPVLMCPACKGVVQ